MAASSKTTLITGPMFSGKTTELIRRANVAVDQGKKVCVVAFKRDTRYGDEGGLITHDGHRLDPRHRCTVRALEDLKTVQDDFDEVFVDEGQFYPDLAEFLRRTSARVTVACLDFDFRRIPFPVVQQAAAAVACQIVPLAGLCACGRPSVYSKRITAETEVMLIGGADKYKPVCDKC